MKSKLIKLIKWALKMPSYKRNGCKVSRNAVLDKSTCLEGYNRVLGSNVQGTKIGFASYVGASDIPCSAIGRFCSIGNNVYVVAGNHPMSYVSTHPCFYQSSNAHLFSFGTGLFFEEIKKTKNGHFVEIGNDVWIGNNVLILSGVTIGDGAVIGAGSVVTKDVPPYSICCGVPAKEIRKRFDEQTISELLNLKWWDADISFLKELATMANDPKSFIEAFKKAKTQSIGDNKDGQKEL